MKITTYDSQDEWLAARKGKITGSRLNDVITKRGSGWKIGVFEIIAERLQQAVEDDDPEETPRDRGHRLEIEAIKRFTTETGKEVDTSLVIWTRDDEDNIAVSPDGSIGDTEAIEIKCLSSAKHIEAWVLQEVPSDYKEQTIQYFIVNENLENLYVGFYDPRIPAKDFFYLTITRASVQEKIDEYLEYQKNLLVSINEIVNDLTF